MALGLLVGLFVLGLVDFKLSKVSVLLIYTFENNVRNSDFKLEKW